jgi:hypothetical protein
LNNLQASVNVTNRVGDAIPITMQGATRLFFVQRSTAAGATAETLGAVTLETGQNEIRVQRNGGQAPTLSSPTSCGRSRRTFPRRRSSSSWPTITRWATRSTTRASTWSSSTANNPDRRLHRWMGADGDQRNHADIRLRLLQARHRCREHGHIASVGQTGNTGGGFAAYTAVNIATGSTATFAPLTGQQTST